MGTLHGCEMKHRRRLMPGAHACALLCCASDRSAPHHAALPPLPLLRQGALACRRSLLRLLLAFPSFPRLVLPAHYSARCSLSFSLARSFLPSGPSCVRRVEHSCAVPMFPVSVHHSYAIHIMHGRGICLRYLVPAAPNSRVFF